MTLPSIQHRRHSKCGPARSPSRCPMPATPRSTSSASSGRPGTPVPNVQGAAIRRPAPICRLEIAEPWREAIAGVERHEQLQVLYWMHLARRDLVRQSPRSDGRTEGTFALRSPVRPNPIASSVVTFVRVEGSAILVRGLDCVDGTPLIDVKPERCAARDRRSRLIRRLQRPRWFGILRIPLADR